MKRQVSGMAQARQHHGSEQDQAGWRIIRSSYTASAASKKQYPADGLPEIAFLGRSNVGKSSLINSLCQHRGLALVSGTPGKTKTVNFFTITSKKGTSRDDAQRVTWYLVDLPGYGFAKTAKGNRDDWSRSIREYVEESPHLRLLCILVDGRHPDLVIDQTAISWLTQMGIRIQLVVTKTDKLKMRDMQQTRGRLAQIYPDLSLPVFYSAATHKGRPQLLKMIHEIVTEADDGTR